MQAAMAIAMPAVEARTRLIEFVAQVAAGLGHVHQRENALVYVRGPIEHGGPVACGLLPPAERTNAIAAVRRERARCAFRRLRRRRTG
jgi:hypothetical protein